MARPCPKTQLTASYPTSSAPVADHRSKGRQGRRGRTFARAFSLIEVMGASALLIVGLTGLTQALTTLRSAGERAERLAARAQVARAWLDRAERAGAGAPLWMPLCAAGESACTTTTAGAVRTRLVDDAGEPDPGGGVLVTWSVRADVPRPSVNAVRIMVADADETGLPLVVESYVR
jgi:type II secretory pathway pseudopilin PulG